jgi:hypothetical protein
MKPKEIIVKIQVPLATNMKEAPALVYDETRAVTSTLPVTEELLQIMEGDLKAFFHAEVEEGEEEDTITIGDRAPWQEW